MHPYNSPLLDFRSSGGGSFLTGAELLATYPSNTLA
jgi:hypothetical protein